MANGLAASWSVFGPDDRLGTANRLSNRVVAQAAANEIRTGERIGLTLPLSLPDPPMFGRTGTSHVVFARGPEVYDDVLEHFYPQGSTQWDGLAHRRDPDVGFYGGRPANPLGADDSPLGVDAWALAGLMGRGILADVEARARQAGRAYDSGQRFVITPDLLQATLDHQGTSVQTGDILLVRTGYLRQYLEADRAARSSMSAEPASAGLAATDEMAGYLWDSGFAAVAADNPAVEALPPDLNSRTLHARLIPMLGFPLGELFTFEDLAAACARDGRYSCFFCSVPLNLRGGVGSPANAVALR
jgi:kynurenine formamidase